MLVVQPCDDPSTHGGRNIDHEFDRQLVSPELAPERGRFTHDHLLTHPVLSKAADPGHRERKQIVQRPPDRQGAESKRLVRGRSCTLPTRMAARTWRQYQTPDRPCRYCSIRS